jgi:dephospho-CoA kinase|tara:strand:+ start:799 stop:1368 length:570 start_codon:yes stop_codon:yes gene_type:complete
MIKIGILGDIGSGKSYVANNFGYPVFNADLEVSTLYKKDRKVFNKLKKNLPKYIYSFPINKNEISSAILANKSNLKKIIKIVHLEIRKKMNIFLKKNINKKIVILDIPLLLENKINKKNDILVFVQSKKMDILKRLKKRKNFNSKLVNKFKDIQLALDFKKKKSQFVIKNNFTKKSVKLGIKMILKEIL